MKKRILWTLGFTLLMLVVIGFQTHTFPALDTDPVNWTGKHTLPSLNGFIYVDGIKYPATATGLQNAITAAGNGTVWLPPGTISVGTTTITVTSGVSIRGAGSMPNGGTIINYTGSGTLFSVAANQGFDLRDVIITGTPNPAVSIAAGGASGQVYWISNVYLAGCTAGVTIGASSPFLIVNNESHFRCSQFDLNIGAATDAYVENNFFDSAGALSSAQGHILVQSGAANVHIYRNTFLGTNTTIPDVTVFVVGGAITGNIHIDDNKFGNEAIGSAAERILISYSGSGAGFLDWSSFSRNFVNNSSSPPDVPDFVKLSSNSISLVDDHFDDNHMVSGPNSGFVVDNPSSPPGSAAQNTAVGNVGVIGLFSGTLNSSTEFVKWGVTDAHQNVIDHIQGELAWKEGTSTGAAVGDEVCYGDSTLHALKCSYNNGTFFQIPQVITATSSAFATATTAGTCVQNTTAVTGAATSMAVSISPVSTLGVGAVWSAFVSSSGNVTINECAVAASAGGSIAFNIRVFP